ncbi:hypothetical protein ACFTAO_39080 [Paenibacillus rhizoplanae]|uniref:Uncharacterized protein n=1 Tax=Paenibacillus rhizoplanae TaxID=1917181 RepID=A0ABW5FBN1_9BACL
MRLSLTRITSRCIPSRLTPIINDNDQPVYVEMTNTFRAPDISAPPEISASHAAVLFSANASNSVTIVLSLLSAVISVRISNPAGSGRTLYLSRISGSIGGTSVLSFERIDFEIGRSRR